MCRKEGGRSTQTGANCVQKAHGLPEDGQRAGQGAGTACVLKQGAQVPPCPALVTLGPAGGLMYPQVFVRSSGASEQTVGSALWMDGKG